MPIVRRRINLRISNILFFNLHTFHVALGIPSIRLLLSVLEPRHPVRIQGPGRVRNITGNGFDLFARIRRTYRHTHDFHHVVVWYIISHIHHIFRVQIIFLQELVQRFNFIRHAKIHVLHTQFLKTFSYPGSLPPGK